MQNKITLRPLGGEMFEVQFPEPQTRVNPNYDVQALERILEKEPCNFAVRLTLAEKLMEREEFEEACQVRYDGCMLALDALPEEDDVMLDMDSTPHNVLFTELIFTSALDHYMIGDFELAAAMFETVLMLDGEDHFGAISPLTFCYVALQEWDSFDEVAIDIAEKSLEGILLRAWADFRRGDLKDPRKRLTSASALLLAEFTADEHPIDDEFETDIASQRPSQQAIARELWLRTSHLWEAFPEFTAALQK